MPKGFSSYPVIKTRVRTRARELMAGMGIDRDMAESVAREMEDAGLLRTGKDTHPLVSRNISVDARAIMGSMFSSGRPVRFRLREQKPTIRAQAALDELVEFQFLERRAADGGIEYAPMLDARPYSRWVDRHKKIAKWKTIERIERAREVA